MKRLIYFIEDDENINELERETLEKNDFEAVGFLEPQSFFKKLEIKKPELIVLDLMLPGMSGYEVLKVLKENKETEEIPVIIVSAKSSEVDIVRGLDMGASDYITKPFGLLEFISRINVNLRKVGMHKNKIIKIRDLSLDIIKHKVFFKDIALDLTSKEYDIMQILMESESIVVTRSKLLKRIWGYDFLVETRTLDMHVKAIREKIAALTDDIYIETVRGVGYIINS